MSEPEPTEHLFDEFSEVDAQAWRSAVEKDLGGTDPDDVLDWTSLEGISVPAYLDREALEELPHRAADTSVPPLADADDRPANAWRLCQPLYHPAPETANEHARTAVENGADALELIVPPPGTDEFGLSVRSTDDLASILDGIELSETRLHLGRSLAAPVLYGALRDLLSAQNVDPTSVHGSVDYDPVAVLASAPSPGIEEAFTLADDLRTDADKWPRFRTVTVDARVYHDAGASAVQELAATLGTLTERLARSVEQDRALTPLLHDLQIIIPVSTSYFVEVAKLRALRLLVPQVVEAFGDETETAVDLGPADLRVRAETSRRTETIYDPHINMLRATTEAMAAVLGGCDALTVRPYDASLRPPDAFGARIARNTHLVLRHEGHFDQVADPAAGSYYIETLTDRLAQRAWTQFQELEAEGGIVEALRSGTLQQQIAETRRARREAIDDREHVLVGATHYPALAERRRDDLVRPTDSSYGNGAPSVSGVSVEALRRALRDGGTVAGVTAALGDDDTTDPLPRIRVAEAVESIRLRTEAHAKAHDGPPQVLLAPLGPPAARSARATFARNFLGVAGFEIEEPLKFETVDEVANAAAEQGSDVVVLCSSDAEYDTLVSGLASALTDRDHDALIGITGAPNDIDASGRADFFVHQNSSLKKTLTTLQNLLGTSTDGS